jgi:hypothetical protein
MLPIQASVGGSSSDEVRSVSKPGSGALVTLGDGIKVRRRGRGDSRRPGGDDSDLGGQSDSCQGSCPGSVAFRDQVTRPPSGVYSAALLWVSSCEYFRLVLLVLVVRVEGTV